METATRTKIQHTTECFICFCCSDDIGQPRGLPITVNYSSSKVIQAMGGGGRPDGRGVRATYGQMVQVKVKQSLYRPGQAHECSRTLRLPDLET
jgi:hypothetical protein